MKNSIFAALLVVLTTGLQSCDAVGRIENMDVVSIVREIDTSSPDHELCSALTLTKEDVAKYFSIADEVDEYEFNDQSLILPCKYRGLVNVDGAQLSWEIIAGGAGYLYNKSVDKRYLCRKECCKALRNLC